MLLLVAKKRERFCDSSIANASIAPRLRMFSALSNRNKYLSSSFLKRASFRGSGRGLLPFEKY